VATGGLILFAALAGPESQQPSVPVRAQVSAPSARDECPVLWGGSLGAFGPNSWTTVGFATQPALCWLELSLGVGLGVGDVSGGIYTDDGVDDIEVEGDGTYVSYTVPLRARFWFFQKHSLIADAGFGITHYRMSADIEGTFGANGTWTRHTTPLVAFVGIGYGIRHSGAKPGPRLSVSAGVFAHLTELGESQVVSEGGGIRGGRLLRAELDEETNELLELEPYGEIAVGWMF